MITNIRKNEPIMQGCDLEFAYRVIAEKVRKGLIQSGERMHNNRETYYKVLHQKINQKNSS